MHPSCDGVFKGWVLNVEQAAFKEVFFSFSFFFFFWLLDLLVLLCMACTLGPLDEYRNGITSQPFVLALCFFCALEVSQQIRVTQS